MNRRAIGSLMLLGIAGARAAADAVVSPNQPSKTAPAQAVVLGPGESARVDGTPLTLTLNTVDEDSRCPQGVSCIWAGDVSVRIRIDQNQTPPREATLHLNVNDRDIVHGDFRVTLVSVTPHPKADEKIDPQTYRATVRVDTR